MSTIDLQKGQLRNARDTRDSRDNGGQYRPPQGVSTLDDETDQERRERLRREHQRIDAETGEHYCPLFPDSAPDCEPQPAADPPLGPPPVCAAVQSRSESPRGYINSLHYPTNGMSDD
ncbi:MAG: hypothetical protein WD738_23900 [Pirellulales bacterium]